MSPTCCLGKKMTTASEQESFHCPGVVWSLADAVLPKLAAGLPLDISNVTAVRIPPLCKTNVCRLSGHHLCWGIKICFFCNPSKKVQCPSRQQHN